jgi:hypothetical protein
LLCFPVPIKNGIPSRSVFFDYSKSCAVIFFALLTSGWAGSGVELIPFGNGEKDGMLPFGSVEGSVYFSVNIVNYNLT